MTELKPIARKKDVFGYPVDGTTSRTIALALRTQGVTRQDRTEKGLLPALNVFNAPTSMDPKQTIEGRGHKAWSAGDKGSRSYHAALCLESVLPNAIVPNYYPKKVSVFRNNTVELMDTKELRQYIKGLSK